MKESEARKKICPHLREHHKVNDGFYCYGSDCMMWESWEFTDADGRIQQKGEGECGLKGHLAEIQQ